ncbi:hypothetical protein BDR04DRAFT_1092364 [Suillus decipiens]|nr:hypothetical protein BDR04DRAFT_1092364 [Suillus decipiens]
MTFFLRYSLLTLLKLFQWAPLLATLDPFCSTTGSIDGGFAVLERHNFLRSNPPANDLPAGFNLSNGSSRVSDHERGSPPSSSIFTYALLMTQHKHYLSNFVNSLALLYSEQLIYLNSGFCSILVLAALNFGLICLYSVTSLQPKGRFHVPVPSWGSLKTILCNDSEPLSAAPSRGLSGTGEFTDRTESACATPDQEAYRFIGAVSHLYSNRLSYQTTDDHGDAERTLSQESRSCHDTAFLDDSPSLASSSSAGFEPVTDSVKPEGTRQPIHPVHLVRNSPPLAEAVSCEKARTHGRPARGHDGEPHDASPRLIIPARPYHEGYLSVSSNQTSFSSMDPQKRSWSRTAAIAADLEENSDSIFKQGSFGNESSGDQSTLGLSLRRSIHKNENCVTSGLLPSASRRNNIQCDSLCHSEPTAMPLETHRRSASTPAPSSRDSQGSSNRPVVTEVKRDDSPSSESEHKFNGTDSFWEAAVQERLRVVTTFTKGAGITLPRTTATDGDLPDRNSCNRSAASSPPWSIVTRKASCTHSSLQQPNSGETQDQAPDDDLVPKPGTPGLASNQADSLHGWTLHSGAYAKYIPPQRRVAGELVYTVSQRTKPMPRRSECVRSEFPSPMLERKSCSSTLSPWSPFAPHKFLSSTTEAIAWKRGALFLANPPPDEFAHIDEFGNEKSSYCANTNGKTGDKDKDNWLSGSLTEKHVARKRTVKDGEEGNGHTSPQQQCDDLWKNSHRRCESFGA